MSCMLISIAQGSAKGMIGQSILSGTVDWITDLSKKFMVTGKECGDSV